MFAVNNKHSRKGTGNVSNVCEIRGERPVESSARIRTFFVIPLASLHKPFVHMVEITKEPELRVRKNIFSVESPHEI
jgi:hypothetical protein